MENIDTFAGFVRTVRLKLLLSREDFAKMLGSNSLTIRNLENGSNKPSFSTLRKFRQFFIDKNLSEYDKLLDNYTKEADYATNGKGNRRKRNRTKDAGSTE